jgi:hypothetical protein
MINKIVGLEDGKGKELWQLYDEIMDEAVRTEDRGLVNKSWGKRLKIKIDGQRAQKKGLWADSVRGRKALALQVGVSFRDHREKFAEDWWSHFLTVEILSLSSHP